MTKETSQQDRGPKSASPEPVMSLPPGGRTFRPSKARQSVIELLRFTSKVPAMSQVRRCAIPRLTRIRSDAEVRVSWAILFFKAYARVCARCPQLRRVYVRWPTTRIYEHPVSVGRMTLVREFDGEEWLLMTKVSDAESQSLDVLNDDLLQMRFGNPEEVDLVRRQVKFGNIPGFLKRLGWMTMLWSGPWRVKWAGTFGLTTVSKFGGLAVVPPVFGTTMLSFGPVSADGSVDVVLAYDHRVIDGADCARAMAELETELETTIADELEAMQPSS